MKPRQRLYADNFEGDRTDAGCLERIRLTLVATGFPISADGGAHVDAFVAAMATELQTLRERTQ